MNFTHYTGTIENEETLEVKEVMTIDEEGKVLDRKIINSDENTEGFPFNETSVASQSNHFLVQLHSKIKNIAFFFKLKKIEN